MTKKNSTPSHVALPLVALLVYAIKLVHFGDDPNLINATVFNGLLTALTPILIISGAIFMFKTMEHSGAMAIVRDWLNSVSGNPVAQLMIIGWAFSFMIEGASGFGTPAALAAPILVGLGFPPLKVAVLTLVMNTVPVSFGAVGTPTWFGMGQLGLQESELLQIGFRSALVHACAALLIPGIALLAVIDWHTVRRNLGFLYLSILSCIVPYVLLARISYEFPALLGGMIGFVLSIAFARAGLGLSSDHAHDGISKPISIGALTKALFPLWATVLVLLVTRLEQLPIKSLLTHPEPILELPLGTLGHLSTSSSLVLALRNIFQTLYVPAIIPFLLVSVVAFAVYKVKGSLIRRIAAESYGRMAHTATALLGALVMVKLLMVGDGESMVILIAKGFAAIAGDNWRYVASLLGALGSFFSGSATISNLTFAGIQDSIATDLGLDRGVILSLQSVGASMGNMVAINNIVAVCSILGVANRKGWILKRTLLPLIVYAMIAGLVGVALHGAHTIDSVGLL